MHQIFPTLLNINLRICLEKSLFIIVFYVLFFFSNAYAEIDTKPIEEITYHPNHQINAKSIALQRSKISPQLSGHIQSILAYVGDQVSKGQTLATLDCTLHQQNLLAAKAQRQKTLNQLALQEKILKRQLSLLKTQNISQTEVDQSETNKNITETSLQEQKIRIKSLSYTVSLCQIKAPFSGTIIQKSAQLGQSASPAISLFTLLNTKKIQIQANIPQHLREEYSRAKNIRFIADKTYHLEKELIIPQVNTNRTIEVRLRSNKPITVGTRGIIKWQSETSYLPAKYLRRHKNQLGIYIISKDNKIDFHTLKNAQEGRANAIKLPSNTSVIINKELLQLGEDITKQ